MSQAEFNQLIERMDRLAAANQEAHDKLLALVVALQVAQAYDKGRAKFWSGLIGGTCGLLAALAALASKQ